MALPSLPSAGSTTRRSERSAGTSLRRPPGFAAFGSTVKVLPYLVITKISRGSARSRADGVMMVRGPTQIFSPFLMATRTSSSLTKSTGCGAAACGAAPAGRGAGCADGSRAAAPAVPEGEPETCDAWEASGVLACAERKRSTMREISAGSGWVGGAVKDVAGAECGDSDVQVPAGGPETGETTASSARRRDACATSS